MANEVRLIDYDAAIDRYYAEYEKQDICCGSQDRDWLKKCFDEAPTIDPESLRPKGRWERECGDLHSSGVLYYCSECGKRHFVNFKHSLPSLQVSEELFSKPNYCPNCGADMRGGK